MTVSAFEAPGVRGWLHLPDSPVAAMVLTHGAGASCRTALLEKVAGEFASRGVAVLRCDLPFRQTRASGPPRTGDAPKDREGLRLAVQALRTAVTADLVCLAGHSYGGRQATILASEDPSVADALLLLSYPLHPPEKPEQLRTAHFPELRTPAFFVHGTKDSFGTPEEMQAAVSLIPAPVRLAFLEGARHDLGAARRADFFDEFLAFARHGLE